MAEKLENGMKNFQKRICPKFQFDHRLKINDDIPTFLFYIIQTAQSIHKLLDDNVLPPFQVDLLIAVKDLVDVSNNAIFEFDDDDDDDTKKSQNDDDNELKQNPDTIKEVEEKLQHTNCCFIKHKSEKLRVYETLNEFKEILSKKDEKKEQVKDPHGIHIKFNKKSYPQNKRFIVYVDRRNDENEFIMFEVFIFINYSIYVLHNKYIVYSYIYCMICSLQLFVIRYLKE